MPIQVNFFNTSAGSAARMANSVLEKPNENYAELMMEDFQV